MKESTWSEMASRSLAALLAIVLFSYGLATYIWGIGIRSDGRIIHSLALMIGIFVSPIYLIIIAPLSVWIDRRVLAGRGRSITYYGVVSIILSVVIIVYLVIVNGSSIDFFSVTFTFACTVIGTLLYRVLLPMTKRLW